MKGWIRLYDWSHGLLYLRGMDICQSVVNEATTMIHLHHGMSCSGEGRLKPRTLHNLL